MDSTGLGFFLSLPRIIVIPATAKVTIAKISLKSGILMESAMYAPINAPGTAKIVSLRARGYVRSFFLEYTKAEVDALVHAAKRLVLATMYGG